MLVPDSTSTSVLFDSKSEVFDLRATAFRRGIIAELNSIEEMLTHIEVKDDLIHELIIWHGEFRRALDTKLDVMPIYNDFVDLLQRILVDSLTQAPLDNEAYLGNDGHCYGRKILCVFENSLLDVYRFRSPLNLQDPDQEEFIVVPHHLARYMVDWLERRAEKLEGLPEIEKAYEELVLELGEKAVERLVPTKRNNRILRIRQEQKFREQNKAENKEIKSSLVSLEKEVKAEVRREFGELEKRVDRTAKEVLERLDRIDQKNHAAYSEVERKMTHLENEQKTTKSAIEELENEISYASLEIEEAEKEQLQVEQSIKKVEAHIEKRKKNRQKQLISTIVIIGACIIGNVLLKEIAPSLSIFPASEGNGLSSIYKI